MGEARQCVPLMLYDKGPVWLFPISIVARRRERHWLWCQMGGGKTSQAMVGVLMHQGHQQSCFQHQCKQYTRFHS